MAKRTTGNTTEERIINQISRRINPRNVKPTRKAMGYKTTPDATINRGGTAINIRRF